MATYSICKELRCPGLRQSGCDRYSVSGHCHLLAGRPRLEGEQFYENSGISNNQYQLYADSDSSLVDINELRQKNDEFFAQSDEVEVLEIKASRGL
jgi:hypothetical protein